MTPDLIAPSGQAPGKVAGGGAPAQCIKDFLGNCTAAASERPGPPSAKPPPKGAQAPASAQCKKDFWGNCAQETTSLQLPSLALLAPSAPAPAPEPPPSGNRSKAPAAAPCEKDFWGNCKQPAPALFAPSLIPQPGPAGPQGKAPDGAGAACQKDFWGNCTQMIPTLLAPPEKVPVKEAPPETAKGNCVRDFWGNCTPVASNRHAYRWRYVRPGNRAGNDRPASGGGGATERIQSAGPAVACHPKRRVVGEEQGTTEQAQLAAEQAWMNSVRFDYGERYQNLATAKEVRYNCSPSSPSAGLKRTMYRCSTEATPCRPSSAN